MTAAAVSPYRLATDQIEEAGVAVTVMYGPVQGGLIVNPTDAVEVLWINIDEPATLGTLSTDIELQPGQTYYVPPGLTTDVSVNAVTALHSFSGYVLQEATPYPPEPQSGDFPPADPVTVTRTIPSYLYVQYKDDENLQAFVDAFNAMAQEYVSWFVQTQLGVYTSDEITGSLLDWVAAGLYGMLRPALSSGRNRDLGPYNTFAFNTLAYNGRERIGPQNITVTTDDIFKRIMTWNFYKGDGKTLNVRWLKRRVMRFLIGENGSAPNIEQTYIISVTFGGQRSVNIRIASGSRIILGGSIYNGFAFNTVAYNGLRTQFVPGPDQLPAQKIFKEALESGALQLPFQYNFLVAA